MELFGKKEVRVHRMLWDVHGKQTYLIDIILTYTLASVVTAFNLFCSCHLSAWKVLLVALLSLDIGGGVVSNFTKGTINYYRESNLSPHVFIWFHLLQSAALICVYWDFNLQIAVVCSLTMLFSSAIAHLYKTNFQLQTSIFLLAIQSMLIAYIELPLPPFILLLLMCFKLMVGYAGNWKRKSSQT